MKSLFEREEEGVKVDGPREKSEGGKSSANQMETRR